jgi:3-hydroxyisobutyrate dehydrogenase-like beta-hydroxyacid dehydrogenase
MAKIAFLGLGQMGAPMAARLLDADNEVTVWNRTREKAEPLGRRGALIASAPDESIAGADVAITMLTDRDAVERVVFGHDGLAAALEPHQTLIEMSTIGPGAVRSIAERLPDGVEMVDAPVRGSVQQAADGSLIILVGASDTAFERVRPILESLGTIHRVGDLGAGAAMKLVANSTIGATMAAFGEALALGEALGLDRSVLLDVLSETPIGTTVKGKRENVESGSYPANFKLALALKDMRLVTDAAQRAGRTLRVANGTLDWYETADAEGAGDLDYSAVVATIARP